MSQNTSLAALDIFRALEDPRQAAKVIYPLNEIILIALCASICGADTFVDFADFGKSKLDFLRTLLPFENGAPSHDTFGAVFANIDRKQFGNLFIEWVEALQERIPALVALDGKTVRRTRNGEIPPVHIISAWASDQELVIGQIKTDVKSNEITAIPELLKMLKLENALVSIDAIGCQKSIAQEIVSQKADYLLSVKRNQKALHAELELVFDAYDADMFFPDVHEHEVLDKGHGRLEQRMYTAVLDVENLEARSNWPELKFIGRVRSIRKTKGKISDETRYFISSRKLSAKEFAKAVRSHWGIENKLHWVMDVAFSDDQSRARTRNAAANFVTLKHITLNLLRRVADKRSVRRKRHLSAWDDAFMLAVLQTPIASLAE